MTSLVGKMKKKGGRGRAERQRGEEAYWGEEGARKDKVFGPKRRRGDCREENICNAGGPPGIGKIT